MKKYLLLLSLLLIPSISYSTYEGSGACSSHGGVNCNAGANANIGVVCYDGWVDSSVNYFDVCEKYPTCLIPNYTGCVTEKEYSDIEISNFRGLNSYAPNIAQELLNNCRIEIEKNKESKKIYEECLEYQKEQQKEKADLEYSKIKQEYEQSLQKIENSIKEMQLELQNSCIKSYGKNSYYDQILEKCNCKEKFILKNNACITYDEDCQNNFGKNSYAVEGNNENSSCSCKDEYEWNKERNFCIPKCPENSYRVLDILCKCTRDNEKYNIISNSCDVIEVEKEESQEQTEEKKEVKENVDNKVIEDNNIQKPEKITLKNIQIKNPEPQPIYNEIDSTKTNTNTENISDSQITAIKIIEDKQVKNNIQQQEEKPIMQKVKENTSSAINNVVSFMKNIFSKLKFW